MGIRVLGSLMAMVVVSGAVAEPGITRLEYGTVSNLIYVSEAFVSHNGDTVAARTNSISGVGEILFRKEEGAWTVNSFPSNFRLSGMNGNGSHFCGYVPSDGAAKYSDESGLILLGGAIASAISDDGNVVVGVDPPNTFRVVGTKFELLTIDIGFFPQPYATNQNGSVVYGFSPGSPSTFFRWDAGVAQPMNSIPTQNGQLMSCNSSGNIAVGGFSMGNGNTKAYRWNGIQLAQLAVDELNFPESLAYSLSDSGELIIGSTHDQSDSGGTALIWINNDTLLTLTEFIEAEGIDLTGWVLNRATDITPDGKYIVGGGQFNGVNSGFIIERDIGNSCAADLTGDGSLDFFDVSAFLTAFSQQDPAADFTGDGSFDFFDVSAFLTAFSEGCP